MRSLWPESVASTTKRRNADNCGEARKAGLAAMRAKASRISCAPRSSATSIFQLISMRPHPFVEYAERRCVESKWQSHAHEFRAPGGARKNMDPPADGPVGANER